EGAVRRWAGSWRSIAWPRLQKMAAERGVPLDKPWKDLSEAHRELVLEGGGGFKGVLPFLHRLQQKSYKAGNRFVVKKYQVPRRCPDCGGARLRPEALQVSLGGKNIAAVCAMQVRGAGAFFAGLELSE